MLGTGDLSELALGWCTYGVGDQMSHYGVNSGVPKTLIQHLIRWVVSSGQFDEQQRGEVNGTLTEILDQEISPELVPAKAARRSSRPRTRSGPTPCSDFTLYHVLRRGYRPSKIAFLALHAWSDADGGRLAGGLPREPPHGIRPRHHPALDGGLRHALLQQPVQALRAAQRPQGRRRWLALAPRRLADAVGRHRARLARGAAQQRPGGLTPARRREEDGQSPTRRKGRARPRPGASATARWSSRASADRTGSRRTACRAARRPTRDPR